MMVSGNLNAHEIESLMDSEIETHHRRRTRRPPRSPGWPAACRPSASWLRGARRGQHTYVGGPAARRSGGMIGSALVGTFLGILLAYGIFEPLARPDGKKIEEAGSEFSASRRPCWPACRAMRPGGDRVRAQGAVLDRAAQLRRARVARQGQEVAEAPREQVMAGDASSCSRSSRRSRRRSCRARRRPEDRSRRLRDGDDGLLPAAGCSARPPRATSRHRGLLQPPLKVAMSGGSGSGDSLVDLKGGSWGPDPLHWPVRHGDVQTERKTYNLQAAKAGGQAPDAPGWRRSSSGGPDAGIQRAGPVQEPDPADITSKGCASRSSMSRTGDVRLRRPSSRPLSRLIPRDRACAGSGRSETASACPSTPTRPLSGENAATATGTCRPTAPTPRVFELMAAGTEESKFCARGGSPRPCPLKTGRAAGRQQPAHQHHGLQPRVRGRDHQGGAAIDVASSRRGG